VPLRAVPQRRLDFSDNDNPMTKPLAGIRKKACGEKASCERASRGSQITAFGKNCRDIPGNPHRLTLRATELGPGRPAHLDRSIFRLNCGGWQRTVS
jgi:hypothetical protein